MEKPEDRKEYCLGLDVVHAAVIPVDLHKIEFVNCHSFIYFFCDKVSHGTWSLPIRRQSSGLHGGGRELKSCRVSFGSQPPALNEQYQLM